jgi:purine-binding chemotaxis protein CheW
MTRTETPQAAAARHGGKFLTFFLAEEEYGLEIIKVREIIGMIPITRVPRTPEHMRGVVNLRGKVIAVVDLRIKFGLEATEQSQRTCIIVVQAGGVEFGVVVDRVSEVANIAGSDIEDPPAFGTGMETEYLLGLAKSQGRVKLLLDLDRVLSSHDVQTLGASAEQP